MLVLFGWLGEKRDEDDPLMRGAEGRVVLLKNLWGCEAGEDNGKEGVPGESVWRLLSRVGSRAMLVCVVWRAAHTRAQF